MNGTTANAAIAAWMIGRSENLKSRMMQAVLFDRTGGPQDVLYLGEVAVPEVGANDVLIRLRAAPISPGDFLFIADLYPDPKRPRFPAQIGGNHGMGVVEKVGASVSIAPGTLVAFSYYNSWAEFAVVPAEWIIPLPADYPLAKGAQLFNLITAWDLLDTATVKPGQWLAITAGYSAVSMMLMQFAKQRNLNVISIIRRRRLDTDLRALGADHVIDLSATGPGLTEQVREISGGGIAALVDSVGGPPTGDLIRAMAFGGKVVINGGMSIDRFELHNFDVLLSGLEIKAHVYRYLLSPPAPDDSKILNRILAAAADEDFVVRVGGIHRLDNFKHAIAATEDRPGEGKRFLAMGDISD